MAVIRGRLGIRSVMQPLLPVAMSRNHKHWQSIVTSVIMTRYILQYGYVHDGYRLVCGWDKRRGISTIVTS